MKILMYKWKAYNHIDVEGNLLLRGHDVDILEETLLDVENQPSFETKLKNTLHNKRYDLVFSINYFPVISDVCEQIGLPYVFWTCDSQISCMYHESIYNSCNHCFLFDKVDAVTFQQFGVDAHYLPLAAPVERIEALLSSSTNLLDYRSEVSFIGSMYNKNLYDQARPLLSPYLQGYFDCALEIQKNLYTQNILQDALTPDTIFELLNRIGENPSPRSFANVPQIFSTSVLGFKAAQLERKSRLTELSKICTLDVYTDDDTAEFLFAKNKGSVSYWMEAPMIFNQSKINLNLTIRTIRTGIPLRIFDVLASGGFLLTNFQAELPLYFENEKDLVWFTSPEEMQEKVTFYLKHDDLRKQIAQNGLQTIKSHHTYQHRLNEMAKIIPGL